MRVSSLGEFALIERLTLVLGSVTSGDQPLLGIGDDAAAWQPTPGTVTVATSDALVEGVHFDLAATSWFDLGWKALAENVSDIAAMGCRPRYGLIALCLPPSVEAADVEDLYRGVAACCEAYACRVVGGDVVRAPCVVLLVTLLGESLPADSSGRPRLLKRSQAQPGDVLAVSGPLGASAGGLRLLLQGTGRSDLTQADEALIRAHRRPEPRVEAGLAMIEAGLRCAIDVSDGLVADVGHICEQSGVDAEIDSNRVSISAETVARFGDAAVDLALSGGEDYELVCAGSGDAVESASARLAEVGRRRLVCIGRVVERERCSDPR